MSNTEIRVYRGTQGMGVIIEICYDKDRIIMDFGAPFTPVNDLYDSQILIRADHRVKDAILSGRIPAINGVFFKKDLEDLDTVSYEESSYHTAVFISHLHLDHMSEIDKIHPAIPVYMHSEALQLKKALENTEEDRYFRDYTPFDYHQIIEVGNIKVEPFFSDHPSVGCAGFIINTPDKRIIYSGDIRFHGLNHEKAWKEIDSVSTEKTDLLFVDATLTHLSDDSDLSPTTADRNINASMVSEEDIYSSVNKQLKENNSLVIVNPYYRDVNMLAELVQLAEENGRIAVFEPLYAYVLYKLKGIKTTVLFPKDGRKFAYHEELRDLLPSASTKDICDQPEKYLLQNSYRHILELIDLEGIKADYFQLFGEPLVKESSDYQILQNMLNKLHFDFHAFSNLYAFSHSYPAHLAELLRCIQPEAAVAVHARNAVLPLKDPSVQKQIADGTVCILKDGQLVEKH